MKRLVARTVLVLTGSVANETDRVMAAVKVRSCEGVRSVDNDLHVKKA